jgi:hypothetical protein
MVAQPAGARGPMMKRMGPRIFCIPATASSTVAVIRRGPSGWMHLSRWDPARDSFEPGSWLHGTMYPQRCDLSPDGRWFVYLALKGGARWDLGMTYLAISRLPWLTALAAWSTGGTWTRGVHFVDDPAIWEAGEPDHGDVAPPRRRFGLALNRPVTFAVERRRGWIEAATTPARGPNDAWDERRADRVTMEKPHPADGTLRLFVNGRHAAFRDMGPVWGRPDYWLEKTGTNASAGDLRPLENVQWADWDGAGRLLVATTGGELQVRDEPFDETSVAWRRDLAALRPDPTPPPADARSW